jgi:CHAD domain-containing protein
MRILRRHVLQRNVAHAPCDPGDASRYNEAMSHAALLSLLDEYAGEILRRQDECWQAPSAVAFHQFRVYIKRMRALLGLVEELSGSKAVGRRRRSFREVFQSAGNVRDLHVQADLVRDVETKSGCEVPWYQEILERRERNAIQAFLCTSHAHLGGDDIAKVRATVDAALAGKSSVKLTSEAWQHFGRCLARTIAFDVESKDLHDLRKRTKEASNLTWILDRVFPGILLDQELKALLDDLQNQLGRWHDFDVAVTWAEAVAEGEIPQENRENWGRFVHALRLKRGALRTKVIKRWTKLAGRPRG